MCFVPVHYWYKLIFWALKMACLMVWVWGLRFDRAGGKLYRRKIVESWGLEGYLVFLVCASFSCSGGKLRNYCKRLHVGRNWMDLRGVVGNFLFRFAVFLVRLVERDYFLSSHAWPCSYPRGSDHTSGYSCKEHGARYNNKFDLLHIASARVVKHPEQNIDTCSVQSEWRRV
jgi:hypothetical protein